MEKMLHPFERPKTLHNTIETFYFNNCGCMLPPHGSHYRRKSDVPFSHGAMGVLVPVIIMKVHMAKRRFKKSRQAPVEVRMPHIEGEPVTFDESKVFRVRRLKKFMSPMFSNENATDRSRAAQESSARDFSNCPVACSRSCSHAK